MAGEGESRADCVRRVAALALERLRSQDRWPPVRRDLERKLAAAELDPNDEALSVSLRAVLMSDTELKQELLRECPQAAEPKGFRGGGHVC